MPSEKAMASEVTGARGKPTVTVLLNGHVIKLPSKYLYLYNV